MCFYSNYNPEASLNFYQGCKFQLLGLTGLGFKRDRVDESFSFRLCRSLITTELNTFYY